jgi:hypothetical protein
MADNWWEQDEVVQPPKGGIADPNQQLKQDVGSAQQAYNFLTAARDAYGLAQRPNAGFGAKARKFFGHESTKDLDGAISTMGANLGFGELKKMREASADGSSGVGGASDTEGELLRAVTASLDIGQSPNRLRGQIAKAAAHAARMHALERGVNPNTPEGQAFVRQIIYRNMGAKLPQQQAAPQTRQAPPAPSRDAVEAAYRKHGG